MNLLVFFPYIPWPLDRGTFQRTYHLLRNLAKHHTVDFLALAENGEGMEHRARFEEFCRSVEFLPFAHPPWTKLLSGRLWDPLPPNVAHWRSAEVKAAVDRKIAEGKYDLVQIVDLVLAPYVLPHVDRVPFVMDRSRVDLQFQLMEHRILRFPWRTRMLRMEGYAKLWMYERKVAAQAALEVVCGPDDKTFIHRRISAEAPVMVVANGVDLSYFRPDSAPDARAAEPTVIFCGAMDYSPNIDALRWYFEEIHDAVRARLPDLRILIVGKNPVPEVKAHGKNPGVTVTGSVPDVRPWYRRAWLQMVPLRIGGGTRLKIVESLAVGTPVVSTTIGAQGLELKDGVEILLGDTPAAFADAVARGLTDKALRDRVEAAGAAAARQRFGWDAIFERLARHYRTLSPPGLD